MLVFLLKESPDMENSTLLVSVAMITYNHENFIRQAIESVLNQNINFEFELIIANDNSPDHTDEIIAEIINDHPLGDRIKYFKHPENIGMMANFIFALEKCKGIYTAICEGDDYWIDPDKLKKQIKILEADNTLSACFTNAIIFDENYKESNYVKFDRRILTPQEIIKLGGGFFPTASFFYRNQNLKFPDFMYPSLAGDRSLSLLLLQEGNFYFLNENTCVYRQHSGGVFNSIKNNNIKRTNLILNNIDILHKFDNYSNYKFKREIKNTISLLSKKVLIRNKQNFISPQFLKLLKNLTIKDFLSLIKNGF